MENNLLGDSERRKSRFDPTLAERMNEKARREMEEMKRNPKIKTQETEKKKIIIPTRNLENPENYILLEGREHKGQNGSYVYEDVLVSKTLSLHNKNWYEMHKELSNINAKMITIRQFVDFLNLLKSGKAFDGKGNKIQERELAHLFDEIVEVKEPWRAEYLDADFKVEKDVLKIHYENYINSGGNLSSSLSAPLEDCLMENKTPGINLNSWLADTNYQGLPKPNIKNGKLYYWHPLKDNNSVAGFVADSDGASLSCGRGPGSRDSSLGVRFVREKNSGGSR